MVEAMLEAVHPIAVIVKSAEYDRTTGAATGGGAIGVGEDRAFGRECVESRRLNNGISITTQGIGTVVIGNDQNDIGPVGGEERIESKTYRGEEAGEGFMEFEEAHDGSLWFRHFYLKSIAM